MKRLFNSIKILLVLLGLSLFLGKGIAQPTIKVMHYNLLFFGDCDGVSTSEKYQWLGTILEHVQPDIFTVNELLPQTAYINGIKALSFDYTDDIDAYPYTNEATSNIVNTLFYNETLFQPVSAQPEVISNPLRDINAYRMIYLPSIEGGLTDTIFITCIVGHFKSSQGASERAQRNAAATSIMNYLANVPDEEYVLVMGDMNVYSNQEDAFQTLVNGPVVSERLIDVTGTNTTGWAGGANAKYHTQSTRSSNPGCGSSGGMDDRFDILLTSQSLIALGSDIRIDSSSYVALGNNGQFYDQELGCSGNNSVPFEVCLALKQMSDHLPVVAELMVNASVSVGEESLRIPLVVIPSNEPGQYSIRFPYPASWDVRIGGMNGQILSDKSIRSRGEEVLLRLQDQPSGWYWITVQDQDGHAGWAKIQLTR